MSILPAQFRCPRHRDQFCSMLRHERASPDDPRGNRPRRGAAGRSASPFIGRSDRLAAGRFHRVLGGGPAHARRRESVRPRKTLAASTNRRPRYRRSRDDVEPAVVAGDCAAPWVFLRARSATPVVAGEPRGDRLLRRSPLDDVRRPRRESLDRLGRGARLPADSVRTAIGSDRAAPAARSGAVPGVRTARLAHARRRRHALARGQAAPGVSRLDRDRVRCDGSPPRHAPGGGACRDSRDIVAAGLQWTFDPTICGCDGEPPAGPVALAHVRNGLADGIRRESVQAAVRADARGSGVVRVALEE